MLAARSAAVLGCLSIALSAVQPGFASAGQTSEEVRLLAEIKRIELRLDGALSRVHAIPRLKRELMTSEERAASLAARVEELEARVGDLRSKLRAARTGANASPDGTVAVLVLFALALAIVLFALAGRSISSRRSLPSSRPSPPLARIERVPSRGP